MPAGPGEGDEGGGGQQGLHLAVVDLHQQTPLVDVLQPEIAVEIAPLVPKVPIHQRACTDKIQIGEIVHFFSR